jgi:hypothetical protein
MSIFSRLFQKEEGGGGGGVAESAPVATATVTAPSVLPPSLPAVAFRLRDEPPVRRSEHQPPRPRPSLPAPTQRRSGVPRRISPAPRPTPPGPIPDRFVEADTDGRPTDSGAIDAALETLFPTPSTPAPPPPPESTAATDHAAVCGTFEALAVAHVRPLRTMMIELRWSEVSLEWLSLARPLLTSLAQMAEQVELPALCQAIAGFVAALDDVAARGGAGEDVRGQLLAAYEPLVQALPDAFKLEGESDRREPIIVQALLRQVPGLEPLLIQRLYSVGLGRLETLGRASAEEIAVVAGLPLAVATAVVAKAQEVARSEAELPDSAAREALKTLLRALDLAHRCYERAAEGWSPESVGAKRRYRREREQIFLQIKVVLARASEVDLALRLETLPFVARIEALDGYLRETTRAVAQA